MEHNFSVVNFRLVTNYMIGILTVVVFQTKNISNFPRLSFERGPVMPIKKDDPNSEKEDLKKTRFFRNRRPKEDLY